MRLTKNVLITTLDLILKKLENPNSPIDMHTHAGSAFDNHVTLTSDF